MGFGRKSEKIAQRNPARPGKRMTGGGHDRERARLQSCRQAGAATALAAAGSLAHLIELVSKEANFRERSQSSTANVLMEKPIQKAMPKNCCGCR